MAVLFAALMGSTAYGDADTIRTLVVGLQHREGVVRDVRGYAIHYMHHSPEKLNAGRGSWPAEQTPPPGVTNEYSRLAVRFLFSGERARWECAVIQAGSANWKADIYWEGRPTIEDPRHGTRDLAAICCTSVVRDGERELIHDSAKGTGRVFEAPRFPTTAAHDPLGHVMMFGEVTQTYSQYLDEARRGAAEDGANAAISVTYGGQERVGEVECHKVVVTRRKRGTREVIGRVELWIAEAYGYAVVRRLSITVPSEGADPRIPGRAELAVADRFRQVAPGIWLPQTTSRQYWIIVGDQPARWWWSEFLEFHDLKANEGVADWEFVYRFPVGTMISDHLGLYRDMPPDPVHKATGYCVSSSDGDSAYVPPFPPEPPLDSVLQNLDVRAAREMIQP